MEAKNVDRVVFSYIRKQALHDGVLVDITREASRRGFILPTAITATAYAVHGEPTKLEHLLSRLHSALVKDHDARDRFVLKTPATDDVVLQIGPDDDGKPVLTIMFTDDE